MEPRRVTMYTERMGERRHQARDEEITGGYKHSELWTTSRADASHRDAFGQRTKNSTGLHGSPEFSDAGKEVACVAAELPPRWMSETATRP